MVVQVEKVRAALAAPKVLQQMANDR